jgi:diguanylate cyclase (GGDEF)-like protein
MNRLRRGKSSDIRERYSVLLDIGRILTGTLRPDDLYRAIYDQTSRVLETAGFYISLYDRSTDSATVVFYADRGRVERVAVTYRGSDSVAIREARAVLTRLDNPEEAILLLGEQREITRLSISAPMLREGNVTGVISAQSYRPDAYDSDDLELLSAVADLAAVALDNAHYVQETERRRREAERLEEIARALTSSLELNEVLDRIVAAVLDLAGGDAASVWLFRSEREIELAVSGGSFEHRIGLTLEVPPELHEWVRQQRSALVLDNPREHPLLPQPMRELSREATVVAVPLFVGDRVFGALALSHMEPRRYRPDELKLLERIAHQASVAVTNAHLHEEIRALSLTDPLTGLANRRHLEMFLDKEFAAARRGRKLAVLLLDLDHFKLYNDRRGHQAGDDVLRAFGRLLAAETRAMNLAARYGGDEFVILLSDSDLAGARIHADRLIESVAAEPDLEEVGVTVGVASYSAEVADPKELIRIADRDLYRRKASRGQAEAAPAAER